MTLRFPRTAARASARSCTRKNVRPGQAEPQAAHAEKWIGLAIRGKAGHRLVAAGVESADGHRPLVRPAQHRVIGAILGFLVRHPVAPGKQKLGAHQADAVGILGVGVFEVLDALDIDQEPDPLAAPGRCRPPQNGARRGPALAVNLLPPLEQADLRRARIELEGGALAIKQRQCGVGDRAQLHHHRNPAPARQHRDMAGRTAAQQRQSSAAGPIDLQETRRRQIVGADDRAARNFHDLTFAAAQDPQHAIAQVDEIGRARLEIFIGGGIIIRDLFVERRRPSAIRRRACADRGKDRIEKVLVFEQARPEIRGSARPRRRRRRQARRSARCDDSMASRSASASCSGRAGRARAVGRRTEADEGPARKTDRGGPATVGQPCHIRAHLFTVPLRENQWRRDRPGLRPPLRRPRRAP